MREGQLFGQVQLLNLEDFDMKTQLRQVIIGSFCKYFQQITDTEGRKHDICFMKIQPQKHHQIIMTEDGYKLALNTYNDIAYLIIGENYHINL